MEGLGVDTDKITKRIRACDYLSVAQLYLLDNFLLKRKLETADIKPRLLGHWGTCHGINVAYANLRANGQMTDFILGPGHGFPALQANLFLDGELFKVDEKAQRNLAGIEYICKNFSWPDGFPSHASPITPGVICEGGELGYSLATAFGLALGHPEKKIAVLIGDGEFETATILSSMNLSALLSTDSNGLVLPILHLNGYKISGPTVYARKSERELLELIRGFGYDPIVVNGDDTVEFQLALEKAFSESKPFIIMKTEKGETGPRYYNGEKIEGNYLSHQIPLKDVKINPLQLDSLERWLGSYKFSELFDETKGFLI